MIRYAVDSSFSLAKQLQQIFRVLWLRWKEESIHKYISVITNGNTTNTIDINLNKRIWTRSVLLWLAIKKLISGHWIDSIRLYTLIQVWYLNHIRLSGKCYLSNTEIQIIHLLVSVWDVKKKTTVHFHTVTDYISSAVYIIWSPVYHLQDMGSALSYRWNWLRQSFITA